MYFDRYTFCPDYLQMPLPAHRYSLYMLFGMHSFIHEKYTYNIISHERQAICKGTEVIGTIHDVGKPYAGIKLKYFWVNKNIHVWICLQTVIGVFITENV